MYWGNRSKTTESVKGNKNWNWNHYHTNNTQPKLQLSGMRYLNIDVKTVHCTRL